MEEGFVFVATGLLVGPANFFVVSAVVVGARCQLTFQDLLIHLKSHPSRLR